MLTIRHKCNNCNEYNNAYLSDLSNEQSQQIECDCGTIIELELSIDCTWQSESETEQEKYESHKFDSRSK